MLAAALLLPAGGMAQDAAAPAFVPPKSLTIALDDNYAPYSFRPEHGEVQGIMRDLWDLWSRRTGVALRFAATGRAQRLQALDAGLVDVAGYVVGTDARAEKYLMAPAPALELDMVIFFDRAISGIAGVESLEGFTIGVMGNGSCAEFLSAHGIKQLRAYSDWEKLFAAAGRREINVFCSGRAAGIRRLYRMNLQAEFKLSPPLFTTPAAWAVRKDQAALRDFIAAGFGLIRPDERAAIEARWIGQPVESSFWDNPALRMLAWMLLAAASGAALLFVWNASLRRQVAAKTMSLASSERRYRELVEAVPIGIFETDATGGNTYANGIWVAMTGLSRTQTLGDGWIGAIHPDDRAALVQRWRAAVEAQRPFHGELRLCRLDGTEIWAMVDAVPRFDAAGACIGMIGSIKDVTERRRHEEEHRQQEAQGQESKKLEALGQFAGGIAHDFNNFLGAILGYAQFIVEDTLLDAGGDPKLQAAGRYAQRILTAGRRGRALVEQILTFTRRTKMTRRRFHLSELLGEIEELMFASASSAMQFRCENADPDAVVEADRDQLGQVLLNLCINAQDALKGRPGGVTVRIRRTTLSLETAALLAPQSRGEALRVWTDADGRATAVAGGFDPAQPHVSLLVGDTGLGMDAALLEQAFTPFFTTKEKGHGTGLGLAVARGIVLAHGALLIAQSREGEGTTIEIVLPRIEIAIPRAEPAPAAALPARVRRRILLVDDDADFCDMMQLLLERLGFEVVPYIRAREALADFRELPATWDALITDQNMPELSGLELLSAVKAVRPDLPCLICSAFSESLTDAALREAGALALIRKPVDKDLLLATLERALGAHIERHARA